MDGKRMRDAVAGATVSISLHDMEALVVGQERWEVIRRLRANGESLSAIR